MTGKQNMMGLIAASLVGLTAGVLAFSWIAGLARVHYLRVHTETVIAAPKAQVWQVLADFGGYPAWNPLMIKVDGETRPGGRMDWTSRLAGQTRQYNARIDRVDVGQELSWTGPISSVGRILFWGEHRFLLEDRADGTVRLVNTERFGGLVTVLISGFLKTDVVAAYEATNAALKAEAERRAAPRETAATGGLSQAR